MDRLAPETLHLICNDLSPRDVTSFRHLSRSCALVGLEHLCAVHTVTLVPGSLERFRELSDNPTLRKGVRVLRFAPLHLPHLNQLSFDVKAKLYNAQRTEWYRSEFKRGEDWAATVRAVEEVGKRLRSLPRLRVLAFPMCFEDAEAPLDLPGLMGLVRWCDLRLDNLADMLTFKLLRLAAGNCPLLDRLEIRFRGDRSVCTHLERSDWLGLLEGFRHLSWEPLEYSDDQPDEDIEEDHHFGPRPMFHIPRHLQTMEIKGGFPVSPSKPRKRGIDYPLFSDVFRDEWFGNLENIRLETTVIDTQHFQSFLENHLHALKSLVIRDLILSSATSITAFLRAFCAHDFDNLETISLEGLWVSAPLAFDLDNYSDFFMDSIIVEGRGLPNVGRLIGSVLQGRWQFVDDDLCVVASTRDAGSNAALGERLLDMLIYWEHNPGLFLAEAYTGSGHILFREDDLYRKLDRFESHKMSAGGTFDP